LFPRLIVLGIVWQMVQDFKPPSWIDDDASNDAN